MLCFLCDFISHLNFFKRWRTRLWLQRPQYPKSRGRPTLWKQEMSSKKGQIYWESYHSDSQSSGSPGWPANFPSKQRKGVEIKPHNVDLIVVEHPSTPKKVKLQETMMEKSIKLSYPERTSFLHNVEHRVELLYHILTPSDAAKLKDVQEDHRC